MMQYIGVLNLHLKRSEKGTIMAFGKNNNPWIVFGPDGQTHVFVGSDHMTTDLSSGTFYTRNGNMVFGSDGSVNTLINDNLSIGTNGVHPIFGPDNGPKTVL